MLLRFPWWLSGKESTCQAGDSCSIPGWRRSPGEWNGNPFQYSCLGNPMARGVWWAAVHGVSKEVDTTKQLSSNKSYLRPVRSLSGNSALPSLPPSLIRMFQFVNWVFLKHLQTPFSGGHWHVSQMKPLELISTSLTRPCWRKPHLLSLEWVGLNFQYTLHHLFSSWWWNSSS